MDILVIVLISLLLVLYFGKRFVYYNGEINAAIHELRYNRDGVPLLKLIADGTIKWDMPFGYGCKSKDGHLCVINSVYFYLKIDGYQAYNLCGHPISDMLECAAINQAKIGNAVDNYTEYLNALPVLHGR